MSILSDKVIFISYNRRDQKIAQKVGEWIDKNDGFKSHIVGFNDSDLKDGIRLTDMLLSRIAACHQIMAIVTANTAHSWWVPWEIGVASEKKFNMSSYLIDNLPEEAVKDLPQYITMNPFLVSKEDVDDYCDTQCRLLLESSSGLRMGGSPSEEVALFRRTLMEKLKSRRGY